MGQGEVIRSMMTPIYSNGNSIIQTTNGIAGSAGCCCPSPSVSPSPSPSVSPSP